MPNHPKFVLSWGLRIVHDTLNCTVIKKKKKIDSRKKIVLEFKFIYSLYKG